MPWAWSAAWRFFLFQTPVDFTDVKWGSPCNQTPFVYTWRHFWYKSRVVRPGFHETRNQPCSSRNQQSKLSRITKKKLRFHWMFHILIYINPDINLFILIHILMEIFQILIQNSCHVPFGISNFGLSFNCFLHMFRKNKKTNGAVTPFFNHAQNCAHRKHCRFRALDRWTRAKSQDFNTARVSVLWIWLYLTLKLVMKLVDGFKTFQGFWKITGWWFGTCGIFFILFSFFFRILVLGILIPTDCHIFRGVVLPQTSISSCLLFLGWCFPSFLDQLMALQVKRHFSEITWLYKSWLNMFELSYMGNSSNKKDT
jgi:hypothetical protein